MYTSYGEQETRKPVESSALPGGPDLSLASSTQLETDEPAIYLRINVERRPI